MASRLDDLIREHAERLDQLAGPIDLTEVTSAPRNDTTNVALIDIEPTWTQPEDRHRWPIIAVAAAAVVAVVVGSLMIATRTDDPTEEIPADQPTTVAPTTTVAPHRETGVVDGIVDGGRLGVTYTVPDGWTNFGTGVIKGGDDAWIGMSLLGAEANFYTRPCVATSGGIEFALVGPTVDDLVSAWANLPGVDVTAARDVTIDGFDGKQIEFTRPALDDCNLLHSRCSFDSPEEPNRPTGCSFAVGGGPFNHTGVPQKVWVLDVNGTRLVILASAIPGRGSQLDRAALDEIVASIEFG
jgi:hypothetical protein